MLAQIVLDTFIHCPCRKTFYPGPCLLKCAYKIDGVFEQNLAFRDKYAFIYMFNECKRTYVSKLLKVILIAADHTTDTFLFCFKTLLVLIVHLSLEALFPRSGLISSVSEMKII